ncbi:hypothetical protein PAPYR_2278 [Paratrimastix pyriformis]|uniref:Uncharacterized protein n=1 Tax=Paratrimastix pyriformis TaxID=342808 RepID=A0ABQ8UQ07_9EUKA|nr:hypothetical protein PAPYR_2278 [Paratrimastix pyriformis]
MGGGGVAVTRGQFTESFEQRVVPELEQRLGAAVEKRVLAAVDKHVARVLERQVQASEKRLVTAVQDQAGAALLPTLEGRITELFAQRTEALERQIPASVTRHTSEIEGHLLEHAQPALEASLRGTLQPVLETSLGAALDTKLEANMNALLETRTAALQDSLQAHFEARLAEPLAERLQGALQPRLAAALEETAGAAVERKLDARLEEAAGSLEARMGGALEKRVGAALEKRLTATIEEKLGAALKGRVGTALEEDLRATLRQDLQDRAAEAAREVAQKQQEALEAAGADVEARLGRGLEARVADAVRRQQAALASAVEADLGPRMERRVVGLAERTLAEKAAPALEEQIHRAAEQALLQPDSDIRLQLSEHVRSEVATARGELEASVAASVGARVEQLVATGVEGARLAIEAQAAARIEALAAKVDQQGGMSQGEAAGLTKSQAQLAESVEGLRRTAEGQQAAAQERLEALRGDVDALKAQADTQITRIAETLERHGRAISREAAETARECVSKEARAIETTCRQAAEEAARAAAILEAQRHGREEAREAVRAEVEGGALRGELRQLAERRNIPIPDPYAICSHEGGAEWAPRLALLSEQVAALSASHEGRTEALQSRLEALEALGPAIEEHGNLLAAVQGQIVKAATQEEVAALLEQLQAAQQDTADQGALMDGQAKAQAALAEQVRRLAEDLGALEGRLDENLPRLDALAQEHQAHEKRVEGAEADLRQLAADAAGQLQAAHGEAQAQAARLGELALALEAEATARQQTHDQLHAQAVQQAEALDAQLAGIRRELGTQTDRIQRTDEALANLKELADGQADRLQQAEDLGAAIKLQVQGHAGRLAELHSGLVAPAPVVPPTSAAEGGVSEVAAGQLAELRQQMESHLQGHAEVPSPSPQQAAIPPGVLAAIPPGVLAAIPPGAVRREVDALQEQLEPRLCRLEESGAAAAAAAAAAPVSDGEGQQRTDRLADELRRALAAEVEMIPARVVALPQMAQLVREISLEQPDEIIASNPEVPSPTPQQHRPAQAHQMHSIPVPPSATSLMGSFAAPADYSLPPMSPSAMGQSAVPAGHLSLDAATIVMARIEAALKVTAQQPVAPGQLSETAEHVRAAVEGLAGENGAPEAHVVGITWGGELLAAAHNQLLPALQEHLAQVLPPEAARQAADALDRIRPALVQEVLAQVPQAAPLPPASSTAEGPQPPQVSSPQAVGRLEQTVERLARAAQTGSESIAGLASLLMIMRHLPAPSPPARVMARLGDVEASLAMVITATKQGQVQQQAFDQQAIKDRRAQAEATAQAAARMGALEGLLAQVREALGALEGELAGHAGQAHTALEERLATREAALDERIAKQTTALDERLTKQEVRPTPGPFPLSPDISLLSLIPPANLPPPQAAQAAQASLPNAGAVAEDVVKPVRQTVGLFEKRLTALEDALQQMLLDQAQAVPPKESSVVPQAALNSLAALEAELKRAHRAGLHALEVKADTDAQRWGHQITSIERRIVVLEGTVRAEQEASMKALEAILRP